VGLGAFTALRAPSGDCAELVAGAGSRGLEGSQRRGPGQLLAAQIAITLVLVGRGGIARTQLDESARRNPVSWDKIVTMDGRPPWGDWSDLTQRAVQAIFFPNCLTVKQSQACAKVGDDERPAADGWRSYERQCLLRRRMRPETGWFCCPGKQKERLGPRGFWRWHVTDLPGFSGIQVIRGNA